MRLFFTEKPDVGRNLAAYLSEKNKIKTELHSSRRYITIGNDVVSWAIGHLLGLAEPDHYYRADKSLKRGSSGKILWSEIPLPIIPEKFANLPKDDEGGGRKEQLKELGRLMKEASEIVNAGDKDREGQYIFDEILEYFDIKGKPVKRLIYSALDKVSLDRAFAEISDNTEPRFKNAGVAAMMRSRADWIIGMNASRAMSMNHRPDEGGVVNIGRVLTPTVSIVVKRQKEIENFKPSKFWTPVVEMPDGTILTWTRCLDEEVEGISDGRIIDQALAEKIVKDINGGLAGRITESKSDQKSEQPPLPFSLPAIQYELSKKYGFSVDEITKACQSLYDKKMQTYVGTDCRYLPESQHSDASGILKGLNGSFGKIVQNADTSIKYKCWNDKMVSGEGGAAHHAIIPTGNTGSFGSEVEKVVYESVCRRYVAQFHPEHQYLSIVLTSEFGKHEFKATARITVSPGWKAIDGEFDGEAEHNADQLKDGNKSSVKAG